MDTFDPKPELEKFAGSRVPKDKKFINSGGRKIGFLTPAFRKFRPGGKSGLLVSDYFPRVREHADKLAVIRSCHTDSHAHGSALVVMNTGKTFIGRPSLGSWVGVRPRHREPEPAGLRRADGQARRADQRSAELVERVHVGRVLRHAVPPVRRSDPRPARPGARHAGGAARATRPAREAEPAAPGRSRPAAANWRRGPRATNWRSGCRPRPRRRSTSTKEAAKTLELYGVGKKPTDEFGRNCLIARRLVERGVRFVQLYCGGGHLEDTWDAHASIETNHGQHAAEVDQPIAALLTDLAAPRAARRDAGRVGRRVRADAVQRGARTSRAGTTTPTASRCGWPAAA